MTHFNPQQGHPTHIFVDELWGQDGFPTELSPLAARGEVALDPVWKVLVAHERTVCRFSGSLSRPHMFPLLKHTVAFLVAENKTEKKEMFYLTVHRTGI